RTTVETDGQRKTVTERTVTEVSVFADTDAVNLAFLHQAFNQLKPQLMNCGEIDAVSGATCSSNGIRDAWEQAMQEVILGETVEIVDSTP
ncbi:MAG: FMN-binding protein, partial [Oscillospiraceae bacterium]|nr:FMN-binding protein [Oscillospiraceae bacterium]